eukprot:1168527-Pleurochrysis_carterae.AAC.1
MRSVEPDTTSSSSRIVQQRRHRGKGGKGTKPRLKNSATWQKGVEKRGCARPASDGVDNEVRRGEDPVRRVGGTEAVARRRRQRQRCRHLAAPTRAGWRHVGPKGAANGGQSGASWRKVALMRLEARVTNADRATHARHERGALRARTSCAHRAHATRDTRGRD